MSLVERETLNDVLLVIGYPLLVDFKKLISKYSHSKKTTKE